MSRWGHACALAAGCLIASGDLYANEVQWAAGLLLICGVAAGAVSPRFPGAQGLLLGLPIPALHYARVALGLPPAFPSSPGSTFLALIPPLLGALFGRLVRHIRLIRLI